MIARRECGARLNAWRECASNCGNRRFKKNLVERSTISAAQLYAILDREFKKLRPAGCTRCHVPLPYWRRPPDDVSANWHIGQPTECPHGCHVVVAELLARLWTRYDIEQQLAQ